MRLLFLALLLTACGPSRVAQSHQRALRLLQHHARDSASVSLRNVLVLDDTRVCGEWNAKNVFGGMTGFERFAVVDTMVVVESAGRGAASDIETYCREAVRDAKAFVKKQ